MKKIQYSQKVIDYFMNPKNAGKIDDADIVATEGSPACGDQVTMYLKIDEDKIKDIKFQSYGCASNIATASIVTEIAKGKTLNEAKNINWQEAAKELDGLPAVKIHCSVLAVSTLLKAIELYEAKKEGKEIVNIVSEENVKKKLSRVIYPPLEKDVLSSNIVSEFKILAYGKNKKVEVFLNIDKDNEFYETIKEDIEENLGELDNCEEVVFIDKSHMYQDNKK